METIIMHPTTQKQLTALKVIAKALGIVYEVGYNPKFVNKILQGREDVKNGKGVKIPIGNLWA